MKLSPAILKPWAIGAVVVLALAVTVWVVGPMIGRAFEPVLPRALIIAAIVACWLGIAVGRAWRDRRSDAAMAADLQKNAAEEADARGEVAAVAERMREAFAFYARGAKRTSWARRRHLYELPFYAIIGAPGAGKTTALLSSGLRFAMTGSGSAESKSAMLRGSGGTRDCVWLFGERAVLIDTAGRFLTQDSNATVDGAGWQSFLQLLKKHRPRRPLNGIVVAVSVEELLRPESDLKALHAQQVAARIEELQSAFDLRLPVYLMVSKCDLLPGFADFFGAMGSQAREQVWGCTFPLGKADEAQVPARSSFDAQADDLTARLHRHLLQRLGHERSEDRRRTMYAFPQQFEALRWSLGEFMDAAFDATRYRRPTLLRGVYFSSGTQDGHSIDQFLANVATTLRARPAPRAVRVGSGDSYFVNRLMRDVVFREAGLAGRSEAAEGRLRWIGWGLALSTLGIGLLLVCAWCVSYRGNGEGLLQARDSTADAARAVHAFGTPVPGDLPALLEALDRVTRIPAALHAPDGSSPLRLGFGLNQEAALSAEVRDRYRELLRGALFPRLAMLLEQELRTTTDPAQTYAALKANAMLHQRGTMDSAWLVAHVKAALAASDRGALADRIDRHVLRLVSSRDNLVSDYRAFDPGVAADAADRLRGTDPVELAFALLQQVPTGTRGVQIDVALHADRLLSGRSGSLSKPIAAIYAADAYRSHIKPAILRIAAQMTSEQAWVLGRPEPRLSETELTRRLHSLYLRRYAEVWRVALGDIRLRTDADGAALLSLDQALQAAQALSADDSALKTLVELVIRETRLSTAGPAPDALRERELEMEAGFEDFRRLAAEGKPGLRDTALADLKTIANKLAAMREAILARQDVRPLAQELAVLRTVAGMQRYPAPIDGIVDTLLTSARGAAQRGVVDGTNVVIAEAAATCTLADLALRYPFKKDAKLEVPVGAFTEMFRQGGEFDTLASVKLQPYIDRSDPRRWKPQPAMDGQPPVVTMPTVEQLQRADRIRRAFMGAGAAAMVTVDLTMPAGGEELTIEYDGVTQVLAPGKPVRLKWSAATVPGLRVRAGTTVVASHEGAWALFRFVDAARLGAAVAEDGPIRLALTGTKGSVAVDLWSAGAVIDPFRLTDLAAFRCPR